MLRRCLDCDCTFSVTNACPRCGSIKALILPDGSEDEQVFARSAAWLFIVHPLLLTMVTRQQPGSVLGTLLFAVGLSGILILVGADLAVRVARSCAVLLVLVELLFAFATGQALLFIPCAIMAVSGLLLLHGDASAGWLPAVRWTGWTACVLTLLLAAAATFAGPLPGWWAGRYLPWTALAPHTDPTSLGRPSGLPAGQRP